MTSSSDRPAHDEPDLRPDSGTTGGTPFTTVPGVVEQGLIAVEGVNEGSAAEIEEGSGGGPRDRPEDPPAT